MDSIDTIGLVVIRYRVEPDPKAACVGHFPTHVVESQHEILDGETVGELLARLGLDEGDEIRIRFPTVAEDRARLAAVLAQIDRLKADRSMHTWNGPDAEVVRDADGAPAPFESFPELNRESFEDVR